MTTPGLPSSVTWLINPAAAEPSTSGPTFANLSGGAMNIANAVWGGGTESAFLDIFLLNGLAELALAESDQPTAVVVFAQAVNELTHAYSGNFGIRGQMSVAAGVATTVGASTPTHLMPEVPASAMPANPEKKHQAGNMPIGLSVAQLGPSADRKNENAVAGGLAGGSIGAGVFNWETGGLGELVLVPSILAGVAKLAVGIDNADVAARLFGAAEHLRGLTHAIHREGRMILFERAYAEATSKARDALGDDGFDITHREGQAMSSAEALGLALQLLASASG